LKFFISFVQEVNKKFQVYGRTCISEFRDLRELENKGFELKDGIFFYFHSNLIDGERNQVIVEVMEAEIDRNTGIPSHQRCLGWAKAKIFQNTLNREKSQFQSESLFTGTPRQLISFSDKCNYNIFIHSSILSLVDVIPSLKLQLCCWQFTEFDDVMNLIPNDCLIAPSEFLPGLVGDHLPLNPLVTTQHEIIRPIDLFIHNARITIPIVLEPSIVSYFQEITKAEYAQTQYDVSNAVSITDRRLCVGCHNGWK
jgi:hypothetical protein